LKNKDIIFFSVDRLGDYIIRSNVIKKISDNFDHKEIVCSEKNFKLINSQSFFNNVYLFNSNNKFLEKIKFIKKFFLKKYDSIIVFDGKNISNILLFIIKANFKFTFIYKNKGALNYIYRSFLIFICDILKINYEILHSRHLIENNNIDNYPKKYKKLNFYFNNIDSHTYYLETTNINIYDNFLNKFIIIHLDEKFKDIKNINHNFESSIRNFQKSLGKKVFLTSFNNNFDYYRNLNFIKIDFKSLENKIMNDSKILIVENMPLNYFQNLMKNSYLNISCHSGFFVHTSLSLNKKTIDIINKSDEIWLDAWIDDKKNYRKVYKSNMKEKIEINNILNSISDEIKYI